MSQASPADAMPLAAQAPVQEVETPEVAETQEMYEAPEVIEERPAEPISVDPNRPLRRKKS